MGRAMVELQKTIEAYEKLQKSLEIKFLEIESFLSRSGLKQLMINAILQDHSDATNITFRYTREGLRITYYRPGVGSCQDFLVFYPWDDPVFNEYERRIV